MKPPIELGSRRTGAPAPTQPAQPARRAVLRFVAALPLAGLAACDVIDLPGQSPPPRLFRLTPKSTFDAALPTVSWQLIVEEPLAPGGLNTTRISLLRSPTEIEYYARTGWADRAPAMTQLLIVESFENSGRIIAVGREAIGLRADFVLKTELREFQAEYNAGRPPTVRVRMNAKLVQMPQRSIIGSRSLERTVVAQADRMESIVAAFDDALGKVLRGLVEWTITTGDAARPSVG